MPMTTPTSRPSGPRPSGRRRPSVPRPSEQHLPQFARASHIMGSARPSTLLFNNASDDFLQWRLTERVTAQDGVHYPEDRPYSAMDNTHRLDQWNVSGQATSSLPPTLNRRSRVVERARKSTRMQQMISTVDPRGRPPRVSKSHKKQKKKKMKNERNIEALTNQDSRRTFTRADIECLHCWEENHRDPSSHKGKPRTYSSGCRCHNRLPDSSATGNRYESHPYGRKSSIRSISSSGSIVQFLFFGGTLDDITTDPHTADLCSLRKKVSSRLPTKDRYMDTIPINPTLTTGLPTLLFEPHFNQWW